LCHQIIQEKIHITFLNGFIIMKQVIALFAFVLVAFAANAQTMTFDVTTVDYGTIEKGSEPLRKFKFTNTGDKPLIIESATGSCGCTVPKYPQEPILPGESNVIEVRYDTQRVGHFTKTVTLKSNDKTNNSMTLTIKGEVKAPAEQPSVPASGGGMNH
jgi:hypothetical protein